MTNSQQPLATDCIFCRIAAGDAAASVVHDDGEILAFMDIRPVTPGHLLVIPRRHAPYLADLDEATGGRIFVAAQQLAAALRASGLRCEGVNLFLADGEAAFQEVFHTHLHVIPRFAGDTFRISADWSSSPAREELDAQAERIRGGKGGEGGIGGKGESWVTGDVIFLLPSFFFSPLSPLLPLLPLRQTQVARR